MMATKIKHVSAEDLAAETARSRRATADRVTACERRVSRGRALTDPNIAGVVELDPPASETERLEAAAYLPQWERELAEARLLAARAVEEDERAQAALKQEKLAAFQPEKRQAVPELARTLLDVRRAVDRLRAIEALEEAVAGPQVERLSAPWAAVVGTGSALHQPHFDVWLAYVRALGFDIGGIE